VSEDPDILLSQIGLRITKRRQDLGMTQRALAEAIEMQPGNLSRIENGEQNVTIRTLCKIAEALDTTVAALVAGP
jgi:transcriptional regulator with XRE-family HTH domain